MPQEIEPPRRTPPAPRGCILLFVVVVALAVAFAVAVGLAFTPRYPGADPF